jgi:glycosyltransferase involved in cell wall biosynthesis
MLRSTRILYLAPCWPAEGAFGAQLRTSQMIRALREIGRVDVIVAKQDEDPVAEARSRASMNVLKTLQLHPIESRSPLERLRCAFDTRFIQYHGQAASAHDRGFVEKQLSKYDLIWVHNLRTANVVGLWSWPHSVMDVDDIPSTLIRTMQENGQEGNGPAGRLRLRTALGRERRLAERFDVLAVCSEADRRHVDFHPRVHVVPNGFARPESEPARQPSNPPRIGFIGLLEYLPNRDSIRWFIDHCWPLIKRQVPDARLRLAGKGGTESGLFTGPDIEPLGWVKDSAAEISTWSAMIVPVRIGAGTRVKIAEGFSRKCPIVSTPLGAHGYDVQHGRELFLADSPAAFADACVEAIRRPADAAAMAERAWKKFLDQWTWEAIQPRVWAAAEDCLRGSGSSTGDRVPAAQFKPAPQR